MPHGLPTSSGEASVVLLRPLRFTSPIGWIGGRYSTSKPIASTRSSRSIASRSVACSSVGASPLHGERGKNSYHALNRARSGSTSMSNLALAAAGLRSMYRCDSRGQASSWSTSASPSRMAARSRSSVSTSSSMRGLAFLAVARSWSVIRSPSSNSTPMSTPASALRSVPWRHDSTWSDQAMISYWWRPSSVGTNDAVQRSFTTNCIGTCTHGPASPTTGAWRQRTAASIAS